MTHPAYNGATLYRHYAGQAAHYEQSVRVLRDAGASECHVAEARSRLRKYRDMMASCHAANLRHLPAD